MSGPVPYNPYRSYQYSTTVRPVAPTRITTSRTELMQLGIAFAVLTLDFTLIFGTGGLLFGGTGGFASISLTVVGIAAAAGLTCFVAHELAHKISAQRHGAWAEFRMAPMWLLFSIFTAFLGWLWAAPGATVVGGMSDRNEWGRTSLAGPLTNIGFSAAFYAGAVALFVLGSDLWGALIVLGFLNGWFGTFNLLPFGPLDGKKVFDWSRVAWVGTLAVAATLAVASYIALHFDTPLFVR